MITFVSLQAERKVYLLQIRWVFFFLFSRNYDTFKSFKTLLWFRSRATMASSKWTLKEFRQLQKYFTGSVDFPKIRDFRDWYCVKNVGTSRFSGPYFPAIGLNWEINRVNLLILFECGKIRNRKLQIQTLFTQWRCQSCQPKSFCEKVLLKISPNLQENTFVRIFLWIKLEACDMMKKETPLWLFSCKYWWNSKGRFFLQSTTGLLLLQVIDTKFL